MTTRRSGCRIPALLSLWRTRARRRRASRRDGERPALALALQCQLDPADRHARLGGLDGEIGLPGEVIVDILVVGLVGARQRLDDALDVEPADGGVQRAPALARLRAPAGRGGRRLARDQRGLLRV